MGVMARVYQIARNKIILWSTPVSKEEFKQFQQKKKGELLALHAEVERSIGVSSEELRRQEIESVRNQIFENPGLVRRMIWTFSGFLHWLKPNLNNLKKWVSENYVINASKAPLVLWIYIITIIWINHFLFKTGLITNFVLMMFLSFFCLMIMLTMHKSYKDKNRTLKELKWTCGLTQTIHIILVFILTNLYIVTPSSSYIGVYKNRDQVRVIDYSTLPFLLPWDEAAYFNTVFYDKEFNVTAEKKFKIQEKDFYVEASVTATLDSERSIGLFKDGELIPQAAEKEEVKKYLETILDEQIKTFIKNQSVNELVSRIKSFYQDLKVYYPNNRNKRNFLNNNLADLTNILLNTALKKQMQEKKSIQSETCCYEVSEEIEAWIYYANKNL